MSLDEPKIDLAKHEILKVAKNRNWELIIHKDGGRLKLVGPARYDIDQTDGLGDSNEERESILIEAVNRLLEDKLISHSEANLYRVTKLGRNVLENPATAKEISQSLREEPKGNAFWSDIHPEIKRVALSRFESNHFADAVESAFKEINSCVKEIVKTANGEELDGAKLMCRAFSVEKPLIILDNLATESGKNIQQGYMQIFAGAMTGIRNPKAHANIEIDRQQAIHFLYLASLLMYKLDNYDYPAEKTSQ